MSLASIRGRVSNESALRLLTARDHDRRRDVELAPHRTCYSTSSIVIRKLCWKVAYIYNRLPALLQSGTPRSK